MPNSTPLRYPGGKARLLPYIRALLVQNQLSNAHYVEPFCGGAGLALELLFDSVVEAIHLNDLDRAVFAFWHSVLNYPDEFCDKVLKTPCDMDVWRMQKEIWNNKEKAKLLDLGFATFFLNRTNRSGILGAGVIGGKFQTGKWKIDARYNKDDLIKRILKIKEFQNCIFIYNEEARDFLLRSTSVLPKDSFIYLDPPYVEKGPGLYLNYYTDNDHRALAKCMTQKINHPWMVSYDDHPLVHECYDQATGVSMSLPYSAYGNARRGTEVFFFSKNIRPPEMPEKKTRYPKPWKANLDI